MGRQSNPLTHITRLLKLPSGNFNKALKTGGIVCLLWSACLVAACSGKTKDNKNDTSSVKFRQYYLSGELLYTNHCSNCHQKTGTGLGRVYPPLDKSDFMENNLAEVVCLIRHGKEGEIMVNGESYVQSMPGIPQLTDLEIAEITTYIYNTWEHERGLIDVKEVSEILNNCKK